MSFSHLLTERHQGPDSKMAPGGKEPTAEPDPKTVSAGLAAAHTTEQAEAVKPDGTTQPKVTTGTPDIAATVAAKMAQMPGAEPATAIVTTVDDKQLSAPVVAETAAIGANPTPVAAGAAATLDPLAAAASGPVKHTTTPVPLIGSGSWQSGLGAVEGKPQPAIQTPSTVQTAPAIATPSVPNSDPATPATPPVPAVVMEAETKVEQTYARTPVVSESQIVADVMKQERAVPAAPTTKPAAATTAELAPTATDNLSAPASPAPAVEAEGPAALDTPAADGAAPSSELSAVAPLEATVPAPHDKSASSQAAVTETEGAAAVAEVVTDRPIETVAHKSASVQQPNAAVSRHVHRQVVQHVATRLDDITGQEKLLIKLNPESLGQIELSFEGRNDRLSVVISSTTPEADAALRENIKDLSDRIVERSSRFSNVDVRIEMRESTEARQDGKSDQNKDGRQEQRRGQGGQEQRNQRDAEGDHARHQAQHARQSWENAMSWQLADEAASEEG